MIPCVRIARLTRLLSRVRIRVNCFRSKYIAEGYFARSYCCCKKTLCISLHFDNDRNLVSIVCDTFLELLTNMLFADKLKELREGKQ